MDLVTLLLSILIAFIIGIVADKVSPFNMPGDWAGAIVAGFIGSWLGPMLLGSWGPAIMGFSLVPSLIGAVLVVIGFGLLRKVFK